jgi:putative membrane protein insertion efficiency factor
MEQIISFIRKMICAPIKAYQYVIRPYLPHCCRFYPSCSDYALLSIERHGILKGLWLGGRRLLHCHPWAEGGYDPVLPNKENV